MKKHIITILFFFLALHSFGQQKKLKEYSHTQFFKMILSEKDSVFKLKDAFITFKKEDSIYSYEYTNEGLKLKATDTLIINKIIDLENVHFEHIKDNVGQALPYLIFNKNVQIVDATSLIFYYCTFNGDIAFDTSVASNNQINGLKEKYENYAPDIGFFNCVFNKNVLLDIGSIENSSLISFNLFYSEFNSIKQKNENEITTNSIRETHFDENDFKGKGYLSFFVDNSLFTSVFENNFGDYRVDFSKESFNDNQVYIVEKNIFNNEFLFHINQFSINHVYRWNQWRRKILSTEGYDLYLKHIIDQDESLYYDEIYKNDSIFNQYKNKYKYELDNSYKFEMQLLGQFYDFYKLQHDSDYANEVYVEFKNLETQRFAYLYEKKPNFNSYFAWKINQFLKIFSGYGTNPSLSVIFSLYVIFIFAFIYMLFPNNWESGRKNKLMNRLQFFTKYFRQKEGIKEIYEEEKQESIMSYNDFRKYMQNSKKEIPSFFLWLTKPIYYFSSYNYKMTGRILKHTDILKGRWVDLPKRRKFLTSIIMTIWILSLIILDLLIKFFNALTLSINTFTTLGFGEIPIKGIPRYLAVIQGFIGWFMLTIFSVSLISQLLN
jgi:hypothetical protein